MDSASPKVALHPTRDLIEQFYTAHYTWSPATLAWYKPYLSGFLKTFQYLPVTPEPVEAFLSAFPEASPERWYYYRALKAFYRWISGAPAKGPKALDGRRNKALGIPNVVDEVKSPPKHFKPATAYSQDEIVLVIRAAKVHQDRLMLLLLAATQIRAEGVYNLKSEDVHDDYIIIKPKQPDREAEEVACPPEVCTALKLLGPGYCFVGHGGNKGRGKPLTRHGVYERVQNCFQAAGVTWGKQGAHAFRHTGATLRLEKTEDLTLLQAALGHSNIATTAMYTHRQSAKQRQRINDTSPFHDLPADLRAMTPAPLSLPGQMSIFDVAGVEEKEAVTA